MKTKPTFHEILISKGWIIGSNPFKKYATCYYKHFNSSRYCELNRRKHKGKKTIQVMLLHSSATGLSGEVYNNFELEIIGQLSDGTSVQLLNYALPYDINRVLRLIPRLIRIWETK